MGSWDRSTYTAGVLIVSLEEDLLWFWLRPLIMVSVVHTKSSCPKAACGQAPQSTLSQPLLNHHGPDHPLCSCCGNRQHQAKQHNFALNDTEHIPSQRSRASLKQKPGTIKQTQRLSCWWPFCYSVLLFLVLSSPTWTVGINLDFIVEIQSMVFTEPLSGHSASVV